MYVHKSPMKKKKYSELNSSLYFHKIIEVPYFQQAKVNWRNITQGALMHPADAVLSRWLWMQNYKEVLSKKNNLLAKRVHHVDF